MPTERPFTELSAAWHAYDKAKTAADAADMNTREGRAAACFAMDALRAYLRASRAFFDE